MKEGGISNKLRVSVESEDGNLLWYVEQIEERRTEHLLCHFVTFTFGTNGSEEKVKRESV